MAQLSGGRRIADSAVPHNSEKLLVARQACRARRWQLAWRLRRARAIIESGAGGVVLPAFAASMQLMTLGYSVGIKR